MANAEMLRKVADKILAEPEHFDMGRWVHETDRGTDCNTVCCIAGHALLMDPEQRYTYKKIDSNINPTWSFEFHTAGGIMSNDDITFAANKIFGFTEDPIVYENEDSEAGTSLYHAMWLDAEGAAKALYEIANDEIANDEIVMESDQS